jgi:hypothetical protein
MRNIFDFLYDKESLWRVVRAFHPICYGRVKIRVATDALPVMILYMNTSVFTIRTYVLSCKYIYILSAQILTKTCSVLPITDSHSFFGSRAAHSHIKKRGNKLVLCCICRRLF